MAEIVEQKLAEAKAQLEDPELAAAAIRLQAIQRGNKSRKS